jgi:hypothetical protein
MFGHSIQHLIAIYGTAAEVDGKPYLLSETATGSDGSDGIIKQLWPVWWWPSRCNGGGKESAQSSADIVARRRFHPKASDIAGRRLSRCHGACPMSA